MTERPIIFSADMVRAILDGTKTQTRRVIKPQPDETHNGEPYWFVGGYRARPMSQNRPPCPYGEPGDVLWVRETWAGQHGRPFGQGALFYRATDGECSGKQLPLSWVEREKRWRSPIHMPRWASRITLRVTGVRVEQVQEITEDDARAEGVEFQAGGNEELGVGYRIGFSALWDSINARRGHGCDTNPWVWVVTFERVAGELEP